MYKKCQLFTHKKIKTTCNTLNWRNWNSKFVKLVVQWAERDIYDEIKNATSF